MESANSHPAVALMSSCRTLSRMDVGTTTHNPSACCVDLIPARPPPKTRQHLYLYLGASPAGWAFIRTPAGRLGLIVAAFFFMYLMIEQFVQDTLYRRGRTPVGCSHSPCWRCLFIGWAITVLPSPYMQVPSDLNCRATNA